MIVKRKQLMRKWLNSNKAYLFGIVSGAICGYLYWQFIGCTSGRCPITSKPLNSTLSGATLGFLLGGIFMKEDSV